ncbi:uncharacterized protein UTRI_10050 [Ustilago trichophora]|uniref:Uncharacterized protein n=1 Tax=Ustilago trichophora TaxID=86804 RepID=A0A5C3DT20_9BASI|nr:uncharacterized protein UTRI_10050 [Ustilago trichophora]
MIPLRLLAFATLAVFALPSLADWVTKDAELEWGDRCDERPANFQRPSGRWLCFTYSGDITKDGEIKGTYKGYLVQKDVFSKFALVEDGKSSDLNTRDQQVTIDWHTKRDDGMIPVTLKSKRKGKWESRNEYSQPLRSGEIIYL